MRVLSLALGGNSLFLESAVNAAISLGHNIACVVTSNIMMQNSLIALTEHVYPELSSIKDRSYDYAIDIGLFSQSDEDSFLDDFIEEVIRLSRESQNVETPYKLHNDRQPAKKFSVSSGNHHALQTEDHVWIKFLRVVNEHPEAIAIIYKDLTLTYADLFKRIQQIQQLLMHKIKDLSAYNYIAFCLDHSPDTIATIFAIVGMGKAFIPIDTFYPEERAKYVLTPYHGIPIITSNNIINEKNWLQEYHCILLEDTGYQDNFPASIDSTAQLSYTAYVLFTSGSTGMPKGVGIKHRSLANLVIWLQNQFPLSKSDRFLHKSLYSFDVSINEIFWPLTNGAALVISEETSVKDPQELLNLMVSQKVSATCFVPSMLEHVASAANFKDVPLRYLISGGEALPVRLKNTILNLLPELTLINSYGPTEATVTIARRVCNISKTSNEPYEKIGNYCFNIRCYVVNSQGELAQLGEPGELWISGLPLSFGYVNNTALTEQKFIPNPFSEYIDQPEHEIVYKTGDLMRMDEEENLHFIGRIDNQVKLHGYRIELSEIDYWLNKNKDINKAVTFLDQAENGSQKLITLIKFGNHQIPSESLRSYLKQFLPEYMMPSLFYPTNEFPLLANGKLDRAAARKLIDQPDQSKFKPDNPVEEKLFATWEYFLSHGNFDRGTSFYNAGGHSLLAMRLTAELADCFQIDILYREVVEKHIFQDQVQLIQKYLADKPNVSLVLPKAKKLNKKRLTTTPIQKKFWINYILTGGAAYNVPFLIKIKGPLSFDKLNRAINTIRQEQEILRTVFFQEQNQLYQKVLTYSPIELETISVDSEAAFESEKQKFSQIGFNLKKEASVKFLLVEYTSTHHILLINHHHIIQDGDSLMLLFNRLIELCVQSCKIEVQKISQYGEYAETQQKLSSYNLNYLHTDHDYGMLPYSQNASADCLQKAKMEVFDLDQNLAVQIETFCKKLNITPAKLFFGAVMFLLHKYDRRKSFTVGNVISHRYRKEYQDTIGCFVDTMPVDVEIGGQLNIEQYLHYIGGLLDQSYDTSKQKELTADDFKFVFAYHELSRFLPYQKLEGLTFEFLLIPNTTPKFDILFNIENYLDRKVIRLEYNGSKYNKETIRNFCIYYIRSLGEFVKNKATVISNVEIFDQNKLNQAALCYPVNKNDKASIIEEFIACVQKLNDKLAITYEREEVTYKQLGLATLALVEEIKKKRGESKESLRVAIITGRNHHYIPAAFAVLLSGGKFIPIDDRWPKDRIASVLEDANPALILTSDYCHKLSFKAALSTKIINVSKVLHSNKIGNLKNLNAYNGSDSGYIIYTSGSTGKPKGVVVKLDSLANTFANFKKLVNLQADSKVISLANYAFDISLVELILPFTVGATCIIASENNIYDHEEFLQLVQVHKPQFLQATPTFWRLTQQNNISFNVPYIISTGEAFYPGLLEFFNKVANTTLNMYGPTEITIWSSATAIKSSDDISIGAPLDGYCYYIVDQNDNILPENIPGELVIQGLGVAEGYYNEKNLSEQKFRNCSKLERKLGLPGARFYYTGDLVELKNNKYFFLGRLDKQVKVAGYRVDLSELEKVAGSIKHVGCAIASLLKCGDQESVYLFVIIKESVKNKLNLLAEINQAMLKKLPRYMQPKNILFIDHIPQTPSGKLDTQALSDIVAKQNSEQQAVGSFTKDRDGLLLLIRTVLQIDIQDLKKSFFSLGANSIDILRLSGELSDFLGINITPLELFKQKDVGSSIRYLLKKVPESIKIKSIDESNRSFLEASPNQKMIFLAENTDKVLFSTFHIPLLFELKSKPSLQLILERIEKVLNTHPLLSSKFFSQNGELKIDLDEGCNKPSIIEIEVKSKDLEKSINEVICTPFNLLKPPLFRVAIISIEETGSCVLALVFHHIIIDALSVLKVLETFFTNSSSKLLTDSKKIPVINLYRRLRQERKTEVSRLLKLKSFKTWAAQLENIKSFHFPDVSSRTEKHRFGFDLDNEIADKVNKFAKKEGFSTFSVTLTCFALVIARLFSKAKFVIFVPLLDSEYAKHKDLAGCFVNLLPVVISISEGDTLKDQIEKIYQSYLTTLFLSSLSFEEICEKQDFRISSELLQIVFNYMPPEKTHYDLDGNNVKALSYNNIPTKFPLSLYCKNVGGNYHFAFNYNKKYFDKSAILGIKQEITHLFSVLDSSAEMRIKDLDGKPEYEVLTKPVQALTLSTLKDNFEKILQRHASEPAICSTTNTWSYLEFFAQVTQCIKTLEQRQGIKMIALMMRHDAPMIAWMFACLIMGITYIPLDEGLPIKRIESILENSRVELLVADQSVKEIKFPSMIFLNSAETVNYGVGIILEILAKYKEKIAADHFAYIIYTSGTTGSPKGVMQSKANLLHHISNYISSLGLVNTDRLSVLASFAFDAAVMDIFAALFSGLCLYINSLRQLTCSSFIEWLELKEITVLHVTPTIMRHWLLETHKGSLASVRMLVLGGEKVYRSDLTLFGKVFEPGSELINNYGPTECTIASQYRYKAGDPLPYSNGVPIGSPVNGVSLQLITVDTEDEFNAGELVIRSNHLALGYINLPEETAKRFYVEGGARCYLTGDLARLNIKGQYEVVGRITHEIKIRGLRVSLDEIESYLNLHRDIASAKVHFDEKDQIISCTAQVLSDLTSSDLRKYLAEYLPVYAIPTVFNFVKDSVMKPNGKLSLSAPVAQVHYACSNLSETERELVELFRKIFKNKSIDSSSEFFTIGGHSLMALNIANEIEKKFNVAFPISVLLNGNSIRDIANYLSGLYMEYVDKNLITLNNSDSDTCIVCIHPVGGTIFCYQRFAKIVFPNLHVVGIQDPSINLQSIVEYSSIEQIAKDYLAAIKKYCKASNYIFVGYSLGGNIAYEMARQLENRKDIALKMLLLIDSWAELHESFFNKENYIANKKAQLLEKNSHKLQEQFWFDLYWSRIKLLQTFKPKPITVKTVLFKANDLVRGFKLLASDDNHWGDSLKDLYVETLDANHDNILESESSLRAIQLIMEPHVKY